MSTLPRIVDPAPLAPRPLYPEVVSAVRAAGLMDRRLGPYFVHFAVNTLGLLAVLAAMVVWHHSWWLVAWAVVLAVVSVQIGFLGHDIAHRQVSRRARTAALLGLVHANLLSGLSYGWWVDKHNAHHAHPNDLETDPDVRAGVLIFDISQARERRGLAALVTRHQAWLFFPMLTFEAVNLYIAGIRSLARPGLQHRPAEVALIAAHTAAYLVVVVTTTSWLQGLVFIAVHQGLRGLYLGVSFAPNHKGMPVLSRADEADPFLRQVLTSRNIRGGPFVDWALGGLNYQIEHHLFPSMPRANLPKAQRIVHSVCERHDVPYVEATARASYAEVLRHLHAVGAPLRAGG
ncbi:acyl-CoA desaturase [Phycicoccus sp. Soil802]|uniref:acyl-CoA desaturase n=1 Tax=Phycicoccus sp. Soil802 TaxID=1736414 RepID=UPI0007034411|nr:acyl-CoA desaturase [Phycicoccus sp. Soil802]KRF28889.1 delta fatty acid desaturase [Phycicoccus sp. Soil802]